MNYQKIFGVLVCCSVAFQMGCGQSPTAPPTPVETITSDYHPTETLTYATREEYSLPNQWDGGLFSEKPCQAPCFAGIIPGTRTESEVMNLIQKNDYFQNCHLEDRPNQGRWISCKGLIININKDNGIADSIGFNTLSIFTLENIVAKYGEPTTVWVAPEGIPEDPQISMIVLLDGKKIRVDLKDQEDTAGTYLLEPSAVITNVVYYSEENGGLTGFLQPWHGYGEYIIDDMWR
jgi:hypothetical protein